MGGSASKQLFQYVIGSTRAVHFGTTMKNLRYIAYTRKSTEDPERQVLSTYAQKQKIQEQFSDLHIVKHFEEHKSAFTEDVRDDFYQMLKIIDNGEADAIIAWHPNRLSRNEVDAARITSRVRKSIIKDLKFCSYHFDNSPEGIWMLQMALSQGQYESAKLSRDVKRGNDTKLSLGGPTGLVPQGYTNNLVTKMADIDKVRFPLIRRMWDLLLIDQLPVHKIWDIAVNEWGYITPKHRKSGGKPISLSTVYKIFTNQFYAGKLVRNDVVYEGKHKAMISLEEFDRAQIILGKKGKPRASSHNFAYSGLMKCGECGCAITAEEKTKLIKSSNKLKTYKYYHCTRKKRKLNCSQTRFIEESVLEIEMEKILSEYTILPEFEQWALKVIQRLNSEESNKRTDIYEMQHKSILAAQNQLDSLIDLATRNLITESKFIEKKEILEEKIEQLTIKLRDTEQRSKDWADIATTAINFATHAHSNFKSGDSSKRKQIMLELGTELQLKDKKLTITPHPWLVPIAKAYPALEKELELVRTKEFPSIKAKTAAISAVISQWQGWQESNPRPSVLETDALAN